MAWATSFRPLENFTDGYQLAGSPFYGILNYNFLNGTNNEVHKSYYVKLERFVDKFDKPLAFYKLHGSIFNRIVKTPFPSQEKIHLKDNYAVSEFYMETTNTKTGEQKFEFLFDEVAPDFLSGTTNKTRYYTDDLYYKNLLNHFENNLFKSDLLFVIRYGFQDKGINEYLENSFLSRGKHMIIIDPFLPATDLIEKYKATYIPKGVTELTYREYIEHIPTKPK